MYKKNIRRAIVLILAVILVAAVFAGCGGSTGQTGGQTTSASGTTSKPSEQKKPTEKPTIRIAHLWTEGEARYASVNEGLNKFVEDNKDVANFSLEAEQGDNLRNKIKIDLAANNLPDIFYYWAITSLKPMYEADLILDVNEYFAKSTKIKAEDFLADAIASYTPDGKNTYAIPTTGAVDYLACNKELFAKYNLQYPKTYKELLAVAKTFSDNGIIPMAVGSKGGNPGHFFFAEVYYQFGTLDYMSKVTTGENKFDYELNRKAADIILEMARNKVFPTDTIGSGDFAPAVSLYNEGKAAMILGQTWSISNFSDEIVEKTELISFPKFEDAVNDPTKFTVGGVNNGWVINKKSFHDEAKQAAIVTAMDYLASDEFYTSLAAYGQFIMKNMQIDPSKVSKLYNMVLDFSKNQKPLTNFWILMPDPVSQEVFSTAIDELWAQTIDAETFCKKVQDSIDKAVK